MYCNTVKQQSFLMLFCVYVADFLGADPPIPTGFFTMFQSGNFPKNSDKLKIH